ncbi:VWA domain-containing protein [Cognatiyoonia sp. IB215182]|uniref:vWA domain-containing protein n=1 Tax=Cognatiyoonia sp. IB215182 TaxID=3097353 RepID=UPI002A14682C|nr:VWA domain-containing protein [Cognatiyoonia sp. IB215182]MDX8352931.1 VWA domain-containing protein [Cognatiyoonia sp. IB215182]
MLGIRLLLAWALLPVSSLQAQTVNLNETLHIGGDTQPAKTVTESLSLDLAGHPLVAENPVTFEVDGVFFIPLDPSAAGQVWTVTIDREPRTRVAVSPSLFETTDDGLIADIETLDRVSTDEAAPPFDLAIPSQAEHLEIATSGPATITLTPRAPIAVGSPTLDVTFGAQAAARVEFPISYDVPADRINLSAELGSPANLNAVVEMRVAGTWLRYAPGTALAADDPVTDIAIRFDRARAFADDPWPVVPLTLALAPIDTDEVEPNQDFATATPIDWPDSKRRTRVDGRLADGNNFDIWRLDHNRDDALEISLELGSGSARLALLAEDNTTLTETFGGGTLEIAPVVLPQGTYFLRIDGGPEAFTRYSLKLKSRRVPGADNEIEPNDVLAQTQSLTVDETVAGTLSRGDIDHFSFHVTTAGRMWGAVTPGRAEMRLMTTSGVEITKGEVDATANVMRLPAVALPVGTYVIALTGAGEYDLTLRDMGPKPEDWEDEPNSDVHASNHLAIGDQMRGQLSDNDNDHIHFDVPSDQYVGIYVRTPDDAEMNVALLYRNTEAFERFRTGPGDEIDQVFWLEAGEYTLLLNRWSEGISQDAWIVRLSAPDAAEVSASEIEPNTRVFARVTAGARIMGQNFGMDPADGYAVPLPAEVGDVFYNCRQASGDITWGIGPLAARGDEVRRETHRNDVLRTLTHDGAADQALFVQHRPGNGLDYDCAAHWATAQTRDVALGSLPDLEVPWASGFGMGEPRFVRAPAGVGLDFTAETPRQIISLGMPQPGQITLVCDVPDLQAAIYNAAGQRLASGRPTDRPLTADIDMAGGYLTFFARITDPLTARCDVTMDDTPVDGPPMPAGTPFADRPVVSVSTPGTYAGDILPGDLLTRPEFVLELDDVNAVFSHCALTNADGEVIQTEDVIDTRRRQVIRPDIAQGLTNFACSFAPLSDLPTLPLTNTSMSDTALPAVTYETRDGWQVPTSFAGGLNVALSRFGGRISAVGDKQLTDADTILIDGTAPFGGMPRVADGVDSITFDLAGDAAWPIVGLHYTHRGPTVSLHDPMRAVIVAASTDGANFAEVGTFPLSIQAHRQYLPFAAPVDASHIRVQAADCDVRFCIAMSELGVIAVPGAYPDTLSSTPNIADPALGGRLISTTADIGLRTELEIFNDRTLRLNVTEKQALDPTDIIIGFWRDRMAQITRVEWAVPADKELLEVTSFEVLAIDSILRPPISLGTLAAPAPGSVGTLELPVGTSARYLILRADLPEGRNHVAGSIRVIEATAEEGGYRSILGTWDEDDPKGPVDWFDGPERSPLPDKVRSSATDPALLPSQETAMSVTRKEDDPDWYSLPPGEATTEEVWRVITLSAPEIVEVGMTLLDPSGAEVPLIPLTTLPEELKTLEEDIAALDFPIPEGWQDNLTFLARLNPAQSYQLRVAEEARLLIMRRERTDMLSNVDVARQRAYAELADILGDGKDAIDIGVPSVTGETLLRGRENILLGMTRLPDPNQDDGVGTADFGTAVAASAETLRLWPGGKTLVYFGMGAGMMQIEDMDWVHQVQDVPVRTISIFAPCNEGSFFCPDPAVAELNPMTFAASTGGSFVRTTSKSELRDALFDAALGMQEPKAYAVGWQDIPAQPAMATLTVRLAETITEEVQEAASAGPPALALILDASGSMLKRLEGERRITIAQSALVDVVENGVPDETAVSFRAFGLAEDSCDTRNLSPLSPLDRASLRAAINDVAAINLAKTPIAASIRAAAAEDLADATGPRAIILLTDGEETCDGDVAGTLTELRNQGINITLSIVGFAIEDDALKADFDNWAALGNGAYFDAGDSDGLQAALSAALETVAAEPVPTMVEIHPLSDAVASERGVPLGETVSLAPGRYRITLDTGQFHEIELQPGQVTEVRTDAFR